MDKYEYKVKADEIKTLISQGQYQEAAAIADEIDWRRVKSVMMLCMVSDLYKINRRLEDSRDLLLLAYDRHPGGRPIVYSLCELSIKMGDYVQAVEYFKEFVQIAPKDSGRYILQYKLYEAQDVSLEERIAVLEELKKRDYRERWAYELAYLYHRVGLASKCVEECDELILWFGKGRYVTKAMELKMLHQPLSPEQQRKYDNICSGVEDQENWEQAPEGEEGEPAEGGEAGYLEQEYTGEDTGYEGEYLPEDQEGYASGEDAGGEPQEGYLPQAEYGEALPQEIGDDGREPLQGEPDAGYEPEAGYEAGAENAAAEPDAERPAVPEVDVMNAPTRKIPTEEIEIQVKTMDMGQYNTMNLQRELAANLKELLAQEGEQEAAGETSGPVNRPEARETAERTGEKPGAAAAQTVSPLPAPLPGAMQAPARDGASLDVIGVGNAQILPAAQEDGVHWEEGIAPVDPEASRRPAARTGSGAGPVQGRRQEPQPFDGARQMGLENLGVEPPKAMAEVLSMEPDGQLSLVVPEAASVEKQITGQLNIQDVLAEWERIKKANQEKHREDIRQSLLQQTGPIFSEFEASAKEGLLEQLEKEPVEETVSTSFSQEEEEYYGEEYPEGQEYAEDVPYIEEDVASGQEGTEEYVPSDQEEVEEYAPSDQEEVEEYAASDQEEAEGYAASDQEEVQEYAASGQKEGDGQEQPPLEVEDISEERAEPSREDEGQENLEELLEIAQPAKEAEKPSAAQEKTPDGDAGRKAPQDPAGNEAMEEAFANAEKLVQSYVDELKMESPTMELFTDEDTLEQMKEVKARAEARREASGEGNASGAADGEPEPQEGEKGSEQERPALRSLTREEKELFGSFLQNRSAKEQLIHVLDTMSLDAYTGNVIVTGDEGMDTLTLAKNLIRDVQLTDSNFSGKIAKISGHALNERNVKDTLDSLANGALIIQKVSELNGETVEALDRALQQENQGIIVVLEDSKKAMNRFLEEYPKLTGSFTARMDMEALSNDLLVAFGKKYAREKEYSIDELGVLALHTRISDMQTIDHAVTILDVKKIIDQAIEHAGKKSVGHFFDVLLSKRYDDEDMIILRESDFI